MPPESHIKYPLRPTLLVIAAERGYEARSLGEITARTLTGDMHRLTAKFSTRAWNIPVIDAAAPDMFEQAWAGLAGQNMAVISGYEGAPEQIEALSRLAQAANPVATLIGIGQSLDFDDAAFRPFQKSLSLLPAGLQDQFDVTKIAMKANRHENTWAAHEEAKAELPLQTDTSRKDYLN